ncbi:hypothetical protein CPB84DRAFT_1963606 [Gymnopilus junonius]|uniref:Uncharacterized protein n=1 Tax=Gymnopilus junonius TaxID=109634 RepID=A0A9P5NJE1_GYMJU|nr:hypothetical protein CPB84DRAFT_1963606 [Gymnopilus junonius]
MSLAAIVVFNSLEILGLSVLTVAIVTAWVSPTVKRTPTWYTFILAGILSSVVQLLLLRQQVGPPPNRTVCFVQGTLIYPMTALNALICAALIFQVYFLLKLTRRSRSLSQVHIFWINAIPIIISLAVLVYALIVGARDQTQIQRDNSGIRCHIVPPKVSDATAGVSVAAGIFILVTESIVVYNMFRNREVYREVLDRSKISPNFLIRICVFNIVVLIVMVCAVWSPKGLNESGRFDLGNISQAVLPAAEGLIFGTQKDILTAWKFWRRKESVSRQANNV